MFAFKTKTPSEQGRSD